MDKQPGQQESLLASQAGGDGGAEDSLLFQDRKGRSLISADLSPASSHSFCVLLNWLETLAPTAL